MEVSQEHLKNERSLFSNMNFDKLRTYEAVAICCIIVLNKIILNPTKNIIFSVGSSSIINMIYVSLIVSLIGYLLIKTFSKFPNNDILDIADFSFGKIFKWIFAIAFIIYFIFVCGISLRSFVENLKIFYQKIIDLRLLLIAFVLAASIANRKGVKSIGKLTLFIMPLTLAGILVTFISVSQEFDWNRIFPIMGNGLDATFLSGASNLYAFSNLAILFFLPPLLEKKTDYKKVTILTILITSTLLIFSIASMLLALSYAFTSSALSPMYLVVRSIEWGSFFESPEAIFTFIFILSMISFLSVAIMIVVTILTKLGKLTNGSALSLSLGELVLGVALIPKNIPSLIFMESVIYKYYSLILIFGISLIVLIVRLF